MYSLVWGKAQQLCFADDHEYYRALGSLCRPGSYTITYETNSDTESWSDAFRIKCLRSDNQTPDAFISAMRTARRINCNDYIENLYKYHDFDFDVGNKVLIGEYSKVKNTVPSQYHFDFDEGYNLRFIRYERRASKSVIKPKQTTNSLLKTSENTTAKTAPIQKPVSTPKPKPLPVEVGEKIIHKAFGMGEVFEVDGQYIRIRFSNVGEKSFVNPDAFNGGFIKKP